MIQRLIDQGAYLETVIYQNLFGIHERITLLSNQLVKLYAHCLTRGTR